MNHAEKSLCLLPTLVLGLVLASCSKPTELSHAVAETVAAPPPPPPKALSPEASIATMQLRQGYRLEPVLTEPQIAEPVMIAFDGNGRMYVAEMRTYMMDADGTGEQEPFSRVSSHEDTDGDGVYDRHTVFADKLLPACASARRSHHHRQTNTDDLYITVTAMVTAYQTKTLWFKGGRAA
jgi:glucose/arabinose dehydrogenase